MAWLETSNRFKDTPKISFKNASFKKKVFYQNSLSFAPIKIFLKSLDMRSPLKFVSQIQTIEA
ncbi:hypothetical protein JP0020_06890 [Helicobacter pylori]